MMLVPVLVAALKVVLMLMEMELLVKVTNVLLLQVLKEMTQVVLGQILMETVY
jgi:hypothetical protein